MKKKEKRVNKLLLTSRLVIAVLLLHHFSHHLNSTAVYFFAAGWGEGVHITLQSEVRFITKRITCMWNLHVWKSLTWQQISDVHTTPSIVRRPASSEGSEMEI